MTSDQQQLLYSVVGFLFLVGLIFLVFRKKKSAPQILDQTAARLASPAITPEPAAVKLEVPPAKEASVESALTNTKHNFWGRISSLWSTESMDQNLDRLEEILYTSDLGPHTVENILDKVKSELSSQQKNNIENLKQAIRSEMIHIFSQTTDESKKSVVEILSKNEKPTVIMIVGVNGAGKTTSIGKISAQLAEAGKKVLVAAGDTFRAAAEGQLKTWTERAQVEIFSSENTKDPSAVAYEALAKAKNQNYDFVIVDTAGRLHTQSHLMEELKKIKRVMDKAMPGAPHEILIVLDANSGQNALLQAKEYHAALRLTGVLLTKMDGTAKGGVAVGLVNDLKIPIKFLGIGEKIHDLKIFSPSEFIDSIM